MSEETDNGRHRVQVDLSQKWLALADDLQVRAGLPTRAEAIREGLAALDFLLVLAAYKGWSLERLKFHVTLQLGKG